MFYPQIFDSPQSRRKISNGSSSRDSSPKPHRSRNSVPSIDSKNSSPCAPNSSTSNPLDHKSRRKMSDGTSSRDSSPKPRRPRNSVPNIDSRSSPSSPRRQKSDTFNKTEAELDTVWSSETGKGRKGRCESPLSPYFQIQKPSLSPSSSRSSSPVGGVKDTPLTAVVSPLAVSGKTFSSENETGHLPSATDQPMKSKNDGAPSSAHITTPSNQIQSQISKLPSQSHSPERLLWETRPMPTKATPPKKPPRTRPRSTLAKSTAGVTTPTISENGLGNMVAVPLEAGGVPFAQSQRFRPYSKKLSDALHSNPAPSLIPENITCRLADLESSLESSLEVGSHGNSGNHGNKSPFPLKDRTSDESSRTRNTSLSPSPAHKSNTYPWRNMGGAEACLSDSSPFAASELEYSLEPRNFSRPVVKSPPLKLDSVINEREEPDSTDHTPLDPPTQDDPMPNLVEKPLPKMSDKTVSSDPPPSPLVTPTNSRPTNLKYPTLDILQVTSSPGTQEETQLLVKESQDEEQNKWKLLETGVYDKLLPISPDSSFSPQLSSSPAYTNHDTIDAAAATNAVVLRSSSKKSPTHSPGKKAATPTDSASKFARRNSEDASILFIAQERRGSEDSIKMATHSPCISPRKNKVVGEASGYKTIDSPHRLRNDSISPPADSISGTEESLNWQYMDPSEYKSPLDKKAAAGSKRSIFNLFGKHDIYDPKNAATLVSKYLVRDGTKVNTLNETGNTPLHCYIKSDRPDRFDIILSFLVHCNCKQVDINLPDSNGDTPLHIATKLNDEWSIKALISFGADINSSNSKHQTPMDLVTDRVQKPDSDSFDSLHELYSQLHAIPGGWSTPRRPRLFDESLNSLVNESYEIEDSVQLGTYLDERRLAAFVFKLEEALSKQHLEFSVNTGNNLQPGQLDPLGTFFDPLIARQNQLLRINEWKSTLEFRRGAGSRMLFLDGGGIRGLIQIEILSCIERMTGRGVTELFDWIIGSSTGGIIALGLVYLGMSLAEARQLYFQLREDVFAGGVLSIARRTETLEAMLKKQFKNKRMSDVEYPKVLISAVGSKTSPPTLHYFNNCFNDKYSTELVWKVARYTSAGPTYFSECDGFIDGGVMANNPCTTAWLEIIHHFEANGLPKPKVAMAISIGTGNYPRETLGETDLFGKGWLDIRGTFKRAHRFIKMLSTALVESENVAQIFSTTCAALDIKFLRFSPSLSLSIRPDETDPKVLLDMIIQTQVYLHSQTCKQDLDKLVRHFHHLAEVSRGLNLNK